MKKKFRYLLFSLSLLTIALVLCSCSAEEKQTATAYDIKDNIYVLARNNQWGVLNSKGEFVIAPQEYSLNILRDSITHAPKYIQASKIIPGEKDEEYGVYWEDNQYLNALYDAEGNLIYDFAEGYFSDVYGDYLRMYRDEKEQLVNMKTGEARDLENTNISTYNGLLVMSDYEKPGIRFYDENMALVKELPDYHFNYTTKDNGKTYFIVQDAERQAGLLDENFNLVVPCEYRWINDVNGNFVRAEDQSQCDVVIDITTGETVMALDPSENLYYYDGNLALIATNDKYGKRAYDMIHLKEDNRIDSYPYLSVINKNTWGQGAGGFLIKNEDGTTTILDKEGKVFLELDEECWASCNENYFIIDYYGNIDGTRPTEMYKLDGTKLDLPKEYASISSMYHYEPLPSLEARYEDRSGNWKTDILDENGNLLVENLQIYTVNDFESDYCDGYRILARRGFSQGMMDMAGNWIYKESAFDSFGNEF
jgi:hypothetical protein